MKAYKKQKISTHYIRLNIFCAGLWLIIAPDFEKANRKLKITSDKLEDLAGYTFSKFIDGWAVIMIKPESEINTIVHECHHFANALYMKVGYNPILQNDELEAYILGWLCEKVEKKVKKHRKYFKK